jgi:uncharacterized membrane protein
MNNPAVPAPDSGLISLTHAVYALHSLSVLLGALGSGTIVGTFLFSFPSIIAVVINYVKRSETRGTFLESHFRWQIRTFWFALGWALAIGAVSAVLLVVLVGIATWIIGIALLGLWVIYRIARGWVALKDRRTLPMPDESFKV